jgi:hypothetical protein
MCENTRLGLAIEKKKQTSLLCSQSATDHSTLRFDIGSVPFATFQRKGKTFIIAINERSRPIWHHKRGPRTRKFGYHPAENENRILNPQLAYNSECVTYLHQSPLPHPEFRGLGSVTLYFRFAFCKFQNYLMQSCAKLRFASFYSQNAKY